MDRNLIPFNRPYLSGNEMKYISEAIKNNFISGDGPFTRRSESLIKEQLGVEKVLLTTSCTHALEMAAILLDLEPGDEIIVPSFTYVSTALAFVMHGAKLVFADIRPDTLNIDENVLEQLITEKTRAIVPVHYAGVSCEMDKIVDLARQYKLVLIEDNAHGLYGKYKGKYLGSFGDLATQSFHETKNIICGEGGALIINNTDYIDRAEIIREKGTNRTSFFRGELDKYTWVDRGSSYVLSDILAAFLYSQLENSEKIQDKRRNIWKYYFDHLKNWANENGVQLAAIPSYCEQSYLMFYLLAPSPVARNNLIKYLKENKIDAVFHYIPLHTSNMGKKLGSSADNCPVSTHISERIVRLPFFNNLSNNEQHHIVEKITEVSF